MFGRLVKHNSVGGIGEKRGPCGHRLENAMLALLPQVVVEIVILRDKLHQAFGLMSVQIITENLRSVQVPQLL